MKKVIKPHILKVITSLFSMLISISVYTQENPEKLQKEANKYIYEAQEAMSENDFASAEVSYRKAIAKDPSNTAAKYNMGNLYYNKEKTVSAEDRLKEATETASTKEEKHKAFHNLGNSYMQMKDYQAAVEAFKNALRNNPNDEETRYNLALAKKMLEKQQNEDQQKDKDGDGEDNKEKDQENKDGEGGEDENKEDNPQDEGENEKDKKEGDEKEDKENETGKNDQKEQSDEGDEKKQQQPQPAQGQLSPEQIKSLLEAMNNEEKKVQDKINAEKAKGVKVKSEKDW